ncbi:protein C3orf33 homolog [Aplochiton taeniatus]
MPNAPYAIVTETETERKGKKSSSNIVSVISRFADNNITFVRNISTGLAIAGVIVIARSIKLTTKFCTVSAIPSHFIERNVNLRGRIKTITEKGLEVEHVPIYVPVLSPLLSTLRLAGVELTPEGRVWMEKHLAPAQTVWLKLISREEGTLHCLVSHSKQGSVFNHCVNEELLRLGLARTLPVSGLQPSSHLYWHLHKRLLRAEVKAEKRGQGLWKEDSLWEKTRRVLRENALVRLIRGISK